jgi:predicted DNA-binding antitoxin AbrB/MazE fold protein
MNYNLQKQKMSEQEPKKPRQPKSKRLNISSKKQWEELLKSIDKKEVPIGLLPKLNVNLKDGTKVTIDIRKLLNEGASEDDLQDQINARLDTLEQIIDDVDYFINEDAVVSTVQPITDNLLRNL